MKVGDTVEALWADGEIVVGEFVRLERGFVLIKDETGKVQPCSEHHCTFKIIKDKK